MLRTTAALLVALLAAPVGATPTRLKDVASLEGVAPLPLIGYGLVVGLNKTGDRRQTIFTAQTLASMLERLGVGVPGDQIKIENTAAVLVTAELPAFVRPGARLDVTASSVGDARSLQGGTLLATALRGPDGTVYALAQGPLSIGGFGGGGGGTSVQVNHLTVGRSPGGGLVQQAPRTALPESGRLALSIRHPDFATATRVAAAINQEFGKGTARAQDPGTVLLDVPPQHRQSVPEFLARIEPLPIEVAPPARIVINERTGTVVIGADVRIATAAVAHGNLSVRITQRFDVSQPAPFSGGQTTVTPREDVQVSEGAAQLVQLDEGVTLEAVVRALNTLGATPRDIIAIVQALKAAGALQADVVIM
jgi:flagellar P-ring protein precursor FlgI